MRQAFFFGIKDRQGDLIHVNLFCGCCAEFLPTWYLSLQCKKDKPLKYNCYEEPRHHPSLRLQQA